MLRAESGKKRRRDKKSLERRLYRLDFAGTGGLQILAIRAREYDRYSLAKQPKAKPDGENLHPRARAHSSS
jgi:branched-chain amino acid transport system substrate-binding protein